MSVTPSGDAEDHLTTVGLADFLARLGKAMSVSPGGNPATGSALLHLSAKLRKFEDVELPDLIDGLTITSRAYRVARSKGRAGGADLLVGKNISELSTSEVRDLLTSRATDLSKQDIVRLGTERLALERPRLEQVGRERALSEVWRAFENLETLDILSIEAARSHPIV